MNAQNVESKASVKKNTKRKIRVDFERAPLKDRLKAKLFNFHFIKKIVWFIFRLVLLVGISYLVLFPFFAKISSSFMSADDFADVTVNLIPKNWTLDMYTVIWEEQEYLKAFFNTFFISAATAVIQTFICSFVSYGLAKFKFKGNGIIFLLVMLTLAIPHQTLYLSMYERFMNFDIFSIFSIINGGGMKAIGEPIMTVLGWFKLDAGVMESISTGLSDFFANIDLIPNSDDTGIWIRFVEGNGVSLINTYWPLIILSLGGLAFKNGLYIFMLRQFFRGVPDELEESAYIDGSGIMRTFFTIILPLSVPMMITVFLFAFSWQWTDEFYIGMFFNSTSDTWLMPDIYSEIPDGLKIVGHPASGLYESGIRNTAGLMIIAPLVVMYLFCQRYLVQGIERSGLTAD